MMNKKETIFKILWRACDTFRGVIDPAQYKDYVLVMLFVKYVSDVWKDKKEHYLKKYDNNEERANWAMKNERFMVPPEARFDYFYENRNTTNIGEIINQGLEALETENPGKLSGEDGAGLFRNIDFNSNNLGDIDNKNSRLRNLLIDFSAEELDLRPSQLDGSDIIGDAYEFLIGHFASDAGKKAGEFYTPKEVSTLVAKLTKSAPGARICDPTCGSGSLLIKAGKEVGSDNFSLYGQEANGSTWALAVMNMFLHELDNTVIRWGDTLRHPKLKEDDVLMKFDTILANPPFSLAWGKKKETREDTDTSESAKTKAFDPATDKFSRFWRGTPPKSKADWLFISHMIETTYEGTGKVGVVVPHGVLFRGNSEGRIRQKTIEENLLEAVIGLPANLFFGTGIPAAILVFSKAKGANKNVLFVDASQHFESGKKQNILRTQDIDKIVQLHQQFKAGALAAGVVEDKYAYVATFEEIQENEFNLNIPRYVDTFEAEALVDMKALAQNIENLETELTSVQAQMANYLQALNLN